MEASHTATAIAHTFTTEQTQFRESLARFLTAKSPPSEVRRLMETEAGYDPLVWKQLCEDLGLAGLIIPESFGGAGFGAVECGIVMEEFGRSLICAPYLSSAVLATGALLHGADQPTQEQWLPRLASGEMRGSLALTEPSGRWDLAAIETVATQQGGEYRLNGAKRFVVDGHTADLLVVAARAPDTHGSDGLGLYLIRGDTTGVTRQAVTTMDMTRKLAAVDFKHAVAVPLGGQPAGAALRQTLDWAAVALANEMVGGAAYLLESSVAYSKLRVQFGRTIGSFQAIKHKCADMLLDVESARSAAYHAAQALAAADSEAPALASLAKAAASQAYLRTAAQAIQIHGGIGFTWENDTHLWFKRAKSSEVFLGTPEYHREQLMQRWGY